MEVHISFPSLFQTVLPNKCSLIFTHWFCNGTSRLILVTVFFIIRGRRPFFTSSFLQVYGNYFVLFISQSYTSLLILQMIRGVAGHSFVPEYSDRHPDPVLIVLPVQLVNKSETIFHLPVGLPKRVPILLQLFVDRQGEVEPSVHVLPHGSYLHHPTMVFHVGLQLHDHTIRKPFRFLVILYSDCATHALTTSISSLSWNGVFRYFFFAT